MGHDKRQRRRRNCPAAERTARWRLWIALLLVLGLGQINFFVGLAGLLGSTVVRQMVQQAGYGVLNVAAGALLLGLGGIALALWRRNSRAARLAFYLAAGVFTLVSGAEVIGIARGDDENAAARITGVLLRLLVFVPLIAGGASAATRVRKQER
jgi:predicted permease